MVSSFVADGREEVVQEVAVRIMNLNHVKARLQSTLHGLKPSSFQFSDLLEGHGFWYDMLVIIGNRRWAFDIVRPTIDLTRYQHEQRSNDNLLTTSVATEPPESQGATVLAFLPA